MGWIGVITNAGNALLAAWAGGSETLYITKATVGSGYVPDANMRTQTALQNQKDTASIVSNTPVGTTGRKLKIRVGPHASAAYTAHEIGIWAKLGAAGTETLLSLHQDSANGIDVPKASDSPEFLFDLNCVLTVSNNGSLTVNIDTMVYVAHLEFEQAQHQDWLMEEGLPNCEATPTYDANGDITGMTHVDVDTSDTMRTDVYTRTSTTITEVRTLASGEVLTITTDLTTQKTTYIFS